MSRSDEYCRFTAECLKMARTAEDEQNRAIFLRMARVWFTLVRKTRQMRIVMAVGGTRSANASEEVARGGIHAHGRNHIRRVIPIDHMDEIALRVFLLGLLLVFCFIARESCRKV
jgi:hypothetical protein